MHLEIELFEEVGIGWEAALVSPECVKFLFPR